MPLHKYNKPTEIEHQKFTHETTCNDQNHYKGINFGVQ